MTTSTEKLRDVCEFSFRCFSTADMKPVIAPITLHSTGSYNSAVGTVDVAARCCVWHLSPQTQKGVSVQEQRSPQVVEPRSVRQTGITRRRITSFVHDSSSGDTATFDLSLQDPFHLLNFLICLSQQLG